ncbi:hypothetical protein BkAM31D_08535 [Halalkalibacter krulwichiae]|uniref:Uncharacterized protein n=1 Tax=Halalkalibacter krulwichiae TaxID=199441 RepID=A0A1X9M940_9BACI|nr:hypothetical protein BkAM31D_08535 [Halalkalibacter krulwichiae]
MAEANAFFKSKEVQDFNREIEQYHLGPLWNAIPDLMHKQPKPEAIPYLWKWEVLEKKLQEATQIFTPERGENVERFIFKIQAFKAGSLGVGLRRRIRSMQLSNLSYLVKKLLLIATHKMRCVS